MRITTRPETCITAGMCVAVAPSHFDQDDDEGTVVVLQEDVDDHQLEVVRRAVECCPVRAIELG